MPCFFVNPSQIVGNKVVILGDDVRHIRFSLRLRESERITVFDGSGAEYEVELTHIQSERTEGKILTVRPPRQPNFRLTLVQALPKGKEKSDFVVQRAVEIGVDRLIFTPSARAVAKPETNRLDNRLQRWQRLATEAAKAARRPTIMPIQLARSLEDIFDMLGGDCPVIVPWEEEKTNYLKTAMRLFKDQKSGAVIVGPEGGFDKTEIELLVNNGAVTVSLGPRILRTELAGIVTAAIVLYEMGEI